MPTKKVTKAFVVPDDVGGRFSVLTAVGLLPIAVSGADIDALMQGAATAQKEFDNDDFKDKRLLQICCNQKYALPQGQNYGVMVSYEPAYTMMSEWFKQLFAESEGKDNKGIFPASCYLLNRPSFTLVSTFRTADAQCLKLLFSLINVKRSYSRYRPDKC